MKRFKLLLTLTCMLISIQANCFPTLNINIAAIDWCPQICPNSADKPGYIIEVINLIFKQADMKISVDYFPWSRAIKNVEIGLYIALLAPAKKEAPKLIFPYASVGLQRMCFYTLKTSGWKYQGLESLHSISIGIAEDTSIEELNEYIKTHDSQFQFQPYHERYVIQNIMKLEKDRVDAFLFTQNSTQYIAASHHKLSVIRNAGCVSEAPIYIAFTPAPKYSKVVEKLINIFEQQMNVLQTSGQIEQILSRYDVYWDAN